MNWTTDKPTPPTGSKMPGKSTRLRFIIQGRKADLALVTAELHHWRSQSGLTAEAIAKVIEVGITYRTKELATLEELDKLE